MSENTDVNDDQPAGSSGGFRRSRRSMRRAERAAEREAYITGQQPLLTRRELKRLREEAEALRAAVEAGELTVEQAKALQNPLADQPDVGAEPRPVTGAHAALPGPGAGSDGGGGVGGGTGTAAGPRGGAAARPAPGLEAAAAAVLEGDLPAAPEPAPRRRRRASSARSASSVSSALSASSAPALSASSAPPAAEPEPQDSVPSWRPRRTTDEVLAIAAQETGMMDPADLPDSSDAPPVRMDFPGTPSTVPERRSVFSSRSTTSQPAEIGSRASGFSPDSGGPARGPAESGRPFQLSPDSGGPAPTASPGRPEPRSDYRSPVSPAGTFTPEPLAQTAARPEPAPPAANPIVPAPLAPEAEPSPWTSSSPSQASPSEMSPSSPTTPSRRPIVRIPSSVQGVRTVDGATGELTSVQFVDEDFDGIDSPRWRALHNSPDHSGHPGRPDHSGHSGRPDNAGRPPRLDSPYGSTAAAEPPMAPTPDEVAARQAWPGAPTVRSAPAPRRGPNRAVLIVLVLLVVAVVAALLWFFFLRGGKSSSAPPPSPRPAELSALSALSAPMLL